MSGILDNKSRILDLVITDQGRQYLASNNGLEIAYFSFTDRDTFYSADLVSGSTDATSRISFEAPNCLPQDTITFQSNEQGNITGFPNSSNIQIKNGSIFVNTLLTSSLITGSRQDSNFLSNTDFSESANDLLASSLENFQKLQIISTHDNLFEEAGFGIGSPEIEFSINEEKPLNNIHSWVSNINSRESFFYDPHFSNVPNFQFLPPISKTNDESIDKRNYESIKNKRLGNYLPLSRPHFQRISYQDIQKELSFFSKNGYSKTINIDPTSQNNRLVCQFFEKQNDKLTKLDVINFGSFRTSNTLHPLANIFFIGKTLMDDKKSETFIHIFTLIFD